MILTIPSFSDESDADYSLIIFYYYDEQSTSFEDMDGWDSLTEFQNTGGINDGPEDADRTFLYWRNNSDGSSVYPGTNWITSDTEFECRKGTYTFYGVWQLNKTPYTIEYKLNEGVWDLDTKYTVETESYTVPTDNPTKQGYTFKGWKCGDDIVEPGETITLESNITLEAVWIEIIPDCTVTFDPNGGTWSGTSMTCPKGTTITISSQVPTRDSYTFLHWSCDGKTYRAGADVTVDSNMTLKAEWTANSSSSPTIPIFPGDEQDAIEVITNDDTDNSWLGKNGKTVLVIAIVVAIIAELAVLSISKR